MMLEQTGLGWNLVHASVMGTSHRDRGGVCQDHADARIVATAAGPVLIAAVADGAGSATHSDLGARTAVSAFLTAAEAALASAEATPDAESVVGWIKAARREVECIGETQGIPLRQLACTLLATVATPGETLVAQIGDGVIVFDGSEAEGYQFAFWPDTGEYANATWFLTDRGYEVHIHSDRLDRPIAALGMMTDGLQMMALNYAASRVHAPFFTPLFRVVTASTRLDADGLQANLAGFLDSPRVNERTDDDKTLLLATRRTSSSPSATDEPPADDHAAVPL